MKKARLASTPLVLALVLGAGVAIAGDLAAPVLATQSAEVEAPLCEPQAPAPAVADAPQPSAAELFLPESQAAAICPRIGCVNEEYCRRDRDCTTAPGGRCDLFCPTQGCCVYP